MIWFIPCFQSYMYPCSRKVPHLQPSWTTSVPWIYYVLSWLHFFKFMDPLYLQPLFSTLLIILHLFFKTTHASFPLRSLPGNKSTTTQTLPYHFCRGLGKPRLYMSLLWFLSHCIVICGCLVCLPTSDWDLLSANTHLVHHGVLNIWHMADIRWIQSGWKKWINAWSIFFIFLLSLGTEFIG